MLAKAFIFMLFCALVAGTHWHSEDKHSAPQPYRFGYDVKDKEGNQFRHEEGDGHGSVKGSYGYTDDKGIYREVHYVADKNGFRAKIKTNEPGTSNQDSADAEYISNAKSQEVDNVRYIPETVPVYHKVNTAPIQPMKSFQQYRSYNLNNHSPINSYSYRSDFPLKHKTFSGQDNIFNQNFGRHVGGSQFNIPRYSGSLGLNSFSNLDGLDEFDGFNSGEIDKIIEELKNKRHVSNREGFSSFNDFGGFSSFNDFGGSNNNGIDKIMEELKNKKKYEYSDGRKSFNDNTFHIREFRNIGDHKYSRSSD